MLDFASSHDLGGEGAPASVSDTQAPDAYSNVVTSVADAVGQQFMAKRIGGTVTEVPGSHAIYVSNPNAVAALIERAASSVK